MVSFPSNLNIKTNYNKILFQNKKFHFKGNFWYIISHRNKKKSSWKKTFQIHLTKSIAMQIDDKIFFCLLILIIFTLYVLKWYMYFWKRKMSLWNKGGIKEEYSIAYLKDVLIFHTVLFLISKQHILTNLPSTNNQNISCIFLYLKQTILNFPF